jgi:hypothetical protein
LNKAKAPAKYASMKPTKKGLPKAIMVDLDGTLSLGHSGRTWYDAKTCNQDALNEPVAEVVRSMAEKGILILLCSGRMDTYLDPTLEFLEKYNIEYDKIWMREAGDYRPDSIIKHNMYDEKIKDKYEVLFVLDDRQQVVDMWRLAFGLTVFQVAPGDF